MPKEIIQPEAQKLDWSDPLTWAKLSKVQVKWLRVVGPQLGIDTSRSVLGLTLIDIIGDDSNIFAFGWWKHSYTQGLAEVGRLMLLERLDNETELEEMPSEIKGRLDVLKDNVIRELWDSPEKVEAIAIQHKEIRTWVEEYMDEHPYLREAEQYRLDIGKLINPYWGEFLVEIGIKS